MEPYLVQKAPATILYIPDFINEMEESYLVDKVNNAPKPKWTYLSNRRLQNWGGLPLPKGMITEPLPDWLKFYVDRVNELGVFGNNIKANHVLVNEYLPGQGIMPHEDGPLFYPTIVTINCGSHTVLKFQKKRHDEDKKESEKPISMFLEPRSLIIVKDSMYQNYLHSIEEIYEDKIDDSIVNADLIKPKKGEKVTRKTRISFTIRNVPKICKFKLNIFK
ncbi:alpha-ketoglutarate-dependent dioxygenase alkB homolog 6 [Cimex lectularius]|uniref:Fe2OG dioxygenase domain-containing protein n=1 Tax=Cimex lectularius TaxID=79782 RepID=A0A8I6RYF4_CIMLE|nr:alpha-ketoglutarate-dependent dioxygenase alkB homolog 6 [Cimex lectularius]